MKAVIRLNVPDWQIGQKVSVYFPDTMIQHGKCEAETVEHALDVLMENGWKKAEPVCAHCEAVHIVQCKDCKFCSTDGENVRFNVCMLNHNKVQSDDWFCADGEKK